MTWVQFLPRLGWILATGIVAEVSFHCGRQHKAVVKANAEGIAIDSLQAASEITTCPANADIADTTPTPQIVTTGTPPPSVIYEAPSNSGDESAGESTPPSTNTSDPIPIENARASDREPVSL